MYWRSKVWLCRCSHLYGSNYLMHNWAPFIWYVQKCMLIWKICFYFSFVFAICSSKMKTRHVTRATYSRKRCSRAGTIFNSRDPFTYTTVRAESGWARLGEKKYGARFRLQKCRWARVQSSYEKDFLSWNCPSERAPFPWIGRALHGAFSLLTNRSQRQN